MGNVNSCQLSCLNLGKLGVDRQSDIPNCPGLSLDLLDMGDKYREESVNGWGTHEGEHRHYGGGGPNFDRLYHKLKVLSLLLLLCY